MYGGEHEGAGEKCGKKAEEITRALDHILKGGIMDCGTCGLQKICDEVEGLRKLHFQGETQNKKASGLVRADAKLRKSRAATSD